MHLLFGGLGAGGRLLLRLQLSRFSKFLLKTIDTAFGVYEFLPAGKERVAARTNFDAQNAVVCRAGLKCVAAGTNYFYFFVRRMDPGFHDSCEVLPPQFIIQWTA